MTSGDGSGVNWDAYTHDELYRMLWEGADVADVSAVADEWRRHGVALTDQAARLRDERTALLGCWHGEAGEEAAHRLGRLADRVDEIAAHAAAGQRAAQDAADALAKARAMMPPPPADPTTFAPAPAAVPSPGSLAPAPMGASTPAPTDQFATAPNSFADLGQSYAGMGQTFADLGQNYAALGQDMAQTYKTMGQSYADLGRNMAQTFGGSQPTSGSGTAFNAIDTGGYSMYYGADGAAQQKAQAVHAMRTYESSLRAGDDLIASTSPSSVTPMPFGNNPVVTAPPSGAPTGPGVPWQQLVGGGGGPLRVTTPTPGPGPVAGLLPPVPGAAPATVAGAVPDAASARPGGHGVMPPVASRGRESEDEEHRNRMPVIDRELFVVTTRTSSSVIG
ncbi:PPE domain-containing protein [Actinophytocola gossypii]|uniref:PPE domain-containing protein n=1 Tax=Actinophytocola gossypii TaxID=2812003 RepID=A0ABT2J3B6_9PSEU|nr:hypothetical protein [Actinophytocola gossypii]MCT2582342.1 hypothetical protein [Actinophytocola gossypii]